MITVTATLKDSRGNPVPDQIVTFPSVPGVTISEPDNKTNAEGQVVASVVSTRAGNYTVLAEHNGKTRPIDISFTANSATADIENNHSSVIETASPAVADGIDSITVTATLMDAEGNPVSGQMVTFPAVDHLNISESTSTTNANGQVVAMVTSTVAGTYSVSAEYNGKQRAVSIVYTDNPATADITNAHSSVIETGSPALADGSAVIKVVATLKDAYGNPVPDAAVTFPSIPGLSIAQQNATTNADGEIEALVTSTAAGTYAVAASYKGKNQPVDISFTADPATADIANTFSSVIEIGSPALADGNAVITVTATLKDAYGNPVPGQKVTFPDVAGLTITEQNSITNAEGQVVAIVLSMVEGDYTVSADFKGKTRSVSVSFSDNPATADIANVYSSLVETGSPAIANGSTVITATATLMDEHGNPVPNESVTFPEVPGLTITQRAAMTDQHGQVMADITCTKAGSYQVAASYKGKSRSVAVAFTADPATADITNAYSLLTDIGSPAVADGTSEVSVIATLADENGNPVSGQTVTFPAVSGLTIAEDTLKTNDDGQVEAKVSSVLAGTYPVVAEYNGKRRAVNIVFEADVSTAEINNAYSSMTEAGSPALADDSAVISITATLRDAHGNPVSGQAIVFPAVVDLNISENAMTTNADGQATIQATSSRAGTYSVVAEYKGNTKSVDVTFDANPVTASIAGISELGSPALADGSAPIAVTVTVEDADGNPVIGQTVNFPALEGLRFTEPLQATDMNGQVTARVTSTQAGDYLVKAELNGSVKSINVTFNANPETAEITSIVESGSPSSADGTDGIVVTATLKDADGNPVPGQAVTFPSVPGLTIVEHARVTNADGRVAASITSTIADTYTVTADYQGNSRSIDVVFKANQATAQIISITGIGSPAIADGSTLVKVTATVKDAEGNPVSNQIVSFPPVPGLTLKGSGDVSNDEGQVNVDATSVKAGAYTISAEYKGKTLSTEVSFVAGPARSVALSSVTGDLIADGSATKNLVATVTDADDNPVENVKVTFSVPADSRAVLGASEVHTNADGQAVTSIKGNTVGTIPVSAKIAVNDRPSGASARTKVVFVAGRSSSESAADRSPAVMARERPAPLDINQPVSSVVIFEEPDSAEVIIEAPDSAELNLW
ncbi:Ig-like domain-containing protein [Endozoicomonas sp.]|uniref:Ig-like domain-containing protein n=1 Tax=Endozoicomonas sp. TaxID=1892382 RepID=UPI003AF4B57A